MRTLTVVVLLLFAVFGLPLFGASALSAEPYGLSAMAQFERLPFLKTDTMAGGQSSFDRTGGNDDTRKFLYTDVTGNVMLDVKGPGTVYRIWCTGFGADTIKIYFDGEATPRINTQLNNLFTGTYSPFLAPLVGNNTMSSGGFYCYLPLPFSKSIKIVTSGSFYYNVGYHLYSPDAAVTTWAGTEDSSVARNQWSNVGSDPKSADGNTTVSNAFNLSARTTQTLLDVSGPRSISSIKLKLSGIPIVTNQAQVFVTDDGRAFTTSNQFKMTLDIANTGATLVRRLDYGIADQAARVYVNGSLVGTWSTPGSDNGNHWRDSSFAIPSSFTSGKKSITVNVQFVSSQIDWNEFYYWAYSTVSGTNRLTDSLDVGNTTSETSHSYSIAGGPAWSGSGNNWSYPLGTNQPSATVMDSLNNLWLKIAFDNEANASVYAPIGTFFGMGQFGPGNIKSLPVGMDADTNFYVYFPMPFTNRAVVQLVSQSTNAIANVVCQINHKPFTNSFANVGYFKTYFQYQTPSTSGVDLLLLDKEGSGHFLGVVQSMAGPTARTYLEGDERIYVDDSLTPALYGTGTEDFYNGGWYFDQGTFTCPSHGYTAHYANTSDYTAAYRLFLADAIPFRKHIRVGIEHGPINDVSETTTTLAYYYYNPNNLAVLTDQLDVGKTSSERSHSYTFTNQQNWVNTPVTYYYEGDSDNVGIADDGRVITNGTSQFTLTLQPTNAGAILRRRFDQGLTNQISHQASVYVAGTLVGTWYRAGTNMTSRWRDDDFMIPAAYTSGKSNIQVRISGANTWSEYYYSLYTLLTAGTASAVPPSTNSSNSNYSNTVASLNPVIYLRLNEASGTLATNIGTLPSVMGTNNATGVTINQAGPRNAAGVPYAGLGSDNTAYALATTGYINLGSPAALTNGNLSALTLMAWVYFGPLDKSEAVIVGYGDDAWSFKRGSGTTVNSNVLVLKINTSNLAVTSGARPITDGVWHHIVAVYDGANARIYIDGTLESSQAKTGGIGTGGNSFNYPVMVGENSKFTGRQFNGKLDEVAMFTNALTAANILAIYNASEVSPTISIQPKSTTVYSGNPVNLSVFALGNAPQSYQWTKGGTVIPGATATNYVLSNPVTGDSGNYAVVITNLYGSITSSVAALTVNDSRPLITLQPPTNVLGLVGATVVVTPVVAGSAPIACQWTLNGTAVNGATNVSLTLGNIQFYQGGNYICYLTNAFGGTNTVTVNFTPRLTTWQSAALPDMGTRDRQCALGSDGTNLFFTRGSIINNTFCSIPKGATNGWTTLTSIPNNAADAAAPGDMCYKDGALWMVCKDTGVNQMLIFRYDIAGNSWTKGTGAFTDAGSALAVVETNYVMAGWAGASSIKIATNWMTGGALSSPPNLGAGASWPWDSCIGLGTDTNVYFIKHNTSAAVAGVLAAINKTGAPVATLISGMPFNPGTGCAIEYMPTNLFSDQHARLFVLRGGTNNTDGDGKGWTMATSTNQLAVYDLAAQAWSLTTLPFSVDGGSEMRLAGDTLYFLSTNSDSAPLKIMKFVDVVPPVIVQSPTNLTVYASQPASFSVMAMGSPLTYQWRFFASNILAGVTNDSYTVANALVTNAGNYDVVVASPGGSVTSAVAVLTVWVAPVISPDPQSRTNVGGTTATFSSGATGTPAPVLSWLKDAAPLKNASNISGAATGALIVSNVHPADAGNYQMVATSAAGGATSQVAVLTFRLPDQPQIAAQQSSSGFIMTWPDPDGVFSLFTATNVAGPFSAIGGASRPYTNPIIEPTRFFLLKWE